MANKIQENINWKPLKKVEDEEEIFYDRSWFCNTKKVIHKSLKEYLQCSDCVTEQDKKEYEEMKRTLYVDWFYLNHDALIDIITQSYSINIKDFKPWL